jgi:starvation-inducible DNA-binding protein
MRLAVLNTSHLNWTKNDLAPNVRQGSAEILNALIVQSIDIALSARHARWNVRGSSAGSLRDQFACVFAELDFHIDALGQRVAALGVVARGTVQDVASESTLKPYPILCLTEFETIESIGTRLGQLGGEMRRGIEECRDLGDPVSADLLIRACTNVDILLWRIESHQVRLQS